jgi:hypothetical protein
MHRMTAAYWFTHKEQGGFPIEKAALRDCDLSVVYVGGHWEWLVRQAGRDVTEGTAATAATAKLYAETVAEMISTSGSCAP